MPKAPTQKPAAAKKTAPKKEKTIISGHAGHKNIYSAILVAQKNFPKIPRNGTGKNDKGEDYNYPLRNDIIDAIRPVLEENGIMFTQILSDKSIKTIVYHTDSDTQLPESVIELKPSRTTQEFGASVTYVSKYAIMTMFGLSIDADNDGAPIPDTIPGKENMVVAEKIPSEVSPEAVAVTTTVSDAPEKPQTVDVSNRTVSFQKAWNFAQSADSKDAIELLYRQINVSTKLTDEEKDEVREVLKAKEQA